MMKIPMKPKLMNFKEKEIKNVANNNKIRKKERKQYNMKLV
jgi:hypothetical protein